MVQNGEGYTPPQYSAGRSRRRIATSNENDTPRDDYDFTFVVESDTQYYNEDYDGNPEPGCRRAATSISWISTTGCSTTGSA